MKDGSVRENARGSKDVIKINHLVVRFANVNGTGSASVNALFTKAVFRMGVPVRVRTGCGSDWILTRLPVL